MRIVLNCFHSTGQSHSSCCRPCCRNFRVRRPRSAVPVAGRYCAQGAMKPRCALPEELQERAAV